MACVRRIGWDTLYYTLYTILYAGQAGMCIAMTRSSPELARRNASLVCLQRSERSVNRLDWLASWQPLLVTAPASACFCEAQLAKPPQTCGRRRDLSGCQFSGASRSMARAVNQWDLLLRARWAGSGRISCGGEASGRARESS